MSKRDERDWIASLIKEVALATKRYISGEITHGERETVYDVAYDAIKTNRQQLVKEIRDDTSGLFPEKKTERYWYTRGDVKPSDVYKEAMKDFLALEVLQENPPTDK